VYVKTQIYSVEASIELVENQEVIARQLLEFLVGQPVGEIADTYQFPETLKDEDYYVKRHWPSRCAGYEVCLAIV